MVLGDFFLNSCIKPSKGLGLIWHQQQNNNNKKTTKLWNLLRGTEGILLSWWKAKCSNRTLKSPTWRNFQASHLAELTRTIWPIRQRSVCSTHNDARELLLPVPGRAEDEQDRKPVIKRDKARSRTSLSPRTPRCPFFPDSFTSQHSSCPLS